MKTRTISSVVLGMILLVLLISGGYLLAAVLCAVSLIGFHEMMMAMEIEEERGFSSLCIGGYLGTIFHYAGLMFCGKEGELSWGIWSFLLVFFVTAILYV
ncbi:MAG: phosphatidate cytidylyltransferase, partial [Lachnospiraceae bacterium]|nr:phosphatidate cytidylyltransferase [Lachnospiraceae bacterium]